MSTEPNPSNDLAREAYVQQLIAEQTGLFAYIVTLLGNLNDASNVLQQTNLVLWRKAEQFTPGTSFHSWSKKTAYYQTLAFCAIRNATNTFSTKRCWKNSRPARRYSTKMSERVALRHCLGTISADSLNLLRQRYTPGTPVADIAKQRRKSEGAIRNALMRIRQTVVECIERQLANAQCLERGIN